MSEALRLANDLDRGWAYKTECAQAAAELRRLARVEEQRDELLEALWVCMEHNRLHYGESHNTVIQARAAIAKAEE